MKNIDIKSLIIGVLLTTIVFLVVGSKSDSRPIKIEPIEISIKHSGELDTFGKPPLMGVPIDAPGP